MPEDVKQKRLRFKMLVFILFFLQVALATSCTVEHIFAPAPAATPSPVPAPTPAPSALILPMDPTLWKQHFNAPGVPYATAAPLMLASDGGLTETFPIKVSRRRFNYLTFPLHGKDLTSYKSISFTIRITVLSGSPVFEWLSPTNNCTGPACNPASARLMIWGPPGDLYSVGDRWWADAAIPMMPGQYSLTVPLDDVHWTGVLGQSGATSSGYMKSLKKVLSLCVTFGGGYFAGHGLDTVNGTAEFELLDYRVNG